MTMRKNITLAVPFTVHRKARIWAANHNTSLSAIVAHLLGDLDALVKVRRQHDAALPKKPDDAANA
jgi:hypothetical protein